MKPFIKYWPIFLLFCCSCHVQEKKDDLPVDDLGRVLHLKSPAKRVVSLTPSITELLGLICDTNQLVGRTTYCNFPKWVLGVRAVTAYPIDFEALVRLKPDLVLIKDDFISAAQLSKLEALGISVYVQRYKTIDDIIRNANIIGQLIGKPERGKFVSDSLQKVRVALSTSIPAKSRTAIVLISAKPIYAYGYGLFSDEILQLSGFHNIVDSSVKGDFPTITPEFLLKRNPQVFIAGDGRADALSAELFNLYPALCALEVYKRKKFYAIDPDLFSRPGPRIFQTVSVLRSIPAYED